MFAHVRTAHTICTKARMDPYLGFFGPGFVVLVARDKEKVKVVDTCL